MADFVPQYSRWRHGGWYVDNVRYPSGACGCVSRNYPDKKWRIVCADQDDVTYPNRDAAARAEYKLANARAAATAKAEVRLSVTYSTADIGTKPDKAMIGKVLQKMLWSLVRNAG